MFILFIVIVVPCYHATGKQGVIIIFVALKVFYNLFITTPLRAMIASRGRGKRGPPIKMCRCHLVVAFKPRDERQH